MNLGPASAARASHRARWLFLSLLVVSGGCAGAIDDGELVPGGPPPPATGGKGGGMGGGMGGTGGSVTPPSAVAPSTRFARLTHKQWENTTRDLLRLPATPGLSKNFVTDTLRSSFDNVAANLAVDGVGWNNYREAAEALSLQVTADPALLAKIVPTGLTGDASARARGFLEAFGRRAYRRPLTPTEIDRYVALMAKPAPGEDPFVGGVRIAIEAFLQSPYFLYRTELSKPSGGTTVALDGYEIASRLSYAIIGSMPDEPLFAAAAAGKLRTREQVAAEAERLLSTPAGLAMIADFHAQLLSMRDYDYIEKSKEQFSMFVPELRADMRRETLALIEDLLVTQKLPIASLFTSKHSFVNSRLAELYGVRGTFTPGSFTRVDLPAGERQGILTHIGFLAANSAGTEPDSIHRGVFVADSVLCKHLPAPVDGVMPPPFDPTKPNRERIENLTNTCGAGCHSLINPAGFAFEHYDGLGRRRTMDAGKPVNAADKYVIDDEWRPFNNGFELQSHIAESREFHECYASKWVAYLNGRELAEEDKPLIKELGQRLRTDKLAVRALILGLVTHDAFLNRAL